MIKMFSGGDGDEHVGVLSCLWALVTVMATDSIRSLLNQRADNSSGHSTPHRSVSSRRSSA